MSAYRSEPLITADGTVRVKWAVAIAAVGLIVTLAAAHNALDKRISSLEYQSQRQGADVQEIKQDIKDVGQDVKTLLRSWPSKSQ